MSYLTPTPARFRPKARMVKILGEHLIRDNTVGLMELIKNGYDADAHNVDVHLLNLGEAEKTVVMVHDDGVGMTEEIIRGPWFEPAHGIKESQKEAGTRTELGRLPLGEKGVGRFAAQKIGRSLVLVTRPRGSQDELVFSIDWSIFEAPDKYMDEIDVPILRRSPRVFTAATSGTRLTMTGAPVAWAPRDVERFQASLIRLLSPRKGVQDFQVHLVCPEFPRLQDLEHYDVLDRFQFRMDCVVEHNGAAVYEYRQRSADGIEERHMQETNLWAEVRPDTWTERGPQCGPFMVQISAWLLEPKAMTQYGINREQLRVLGGVSIYRDGFRVLPYGDEGDDWLALDQRRINTPAERFGNRQIIGIVDIDQQRNSRLMDKTNREGLQENQAYRDLQELVIGVVQKLEQESLDKRRSMRARTSSKRDLQETIKKLQQQVDRITAETDQRAPTPVRGTIQNLLGKQVPRPLPIDAVVVSRHDLNSLQTHTIEVSAAAKEEAEAHEALLHLAGIGLAAERFCHEFDVMVQGATEAFRLLKMSPGIDDSSVGFLETFVYALRNEVRLMGTLRYVRRSQASRTCSARETVENVLTSQESRIHHHHIETSLNLKDDFEIQIAPASLAQVVNNVVDNAVYWLASKPEVNSRRLTVTLSSTGRSILITNTGPSVVPSVRKRLFTEPFITGKPNGHGLGMFISSEIMNRNGGKVELLDTDEGAAFLLSFPVSDLPQ